MTLITSNLWTVLSILILCRFGNSVPAINDEEKQMIIDHAPVIWFHDEEQFFPSSIEYFFDNTEVHDESENTLQTNPTRSTVLHGEESATMHLNSVPDLECPSCLQDWFYGQPISQVPVYIYVRKYDDACGTLDVAYRANFPYNYGKDVCVGLEIDGECRPSDITRGYGNHVGDWEHMALRFLNGKLSSGYISAHHFGAQYTWIETENHFELTFGEDFFGDIVPGKYPEYINMFEGNHPEIFCANGSHGIWAQTGTYTYLPFPVKLIDECNRGTAWKTWENMEFIMYEESGVYEGDYTYADFRGRWGNLEDGCGILEPIHGECILSSGPKHYSPFPSTKNYPTVCED